MTMRPWRLFAHAVAAALIFDLILGTAYTIAAHLPWWHGLYCAYMTSVTEGPDVMPRGELQHVIIMLSALFPLVAFSAAWAFAISALNGKKLARSEDRIMRALKAHIEQLENERKARETEPAGPPRSR